MKDTDRIKIKEVIVVEGKYDKITLSNIVDTLIIETRGFGVFKDKEKLNLLRLMAEKRGLLILTDSDKAGMVIRNYLTGSINTEYIKHAYIPELFGKEKRKDSASKEGLLGVEGMNREKLVLAIERSGVKISGQERHGNQAGQAAITFGDLYELGLTSQKGSGQKRIKLFEFLQLPQKVTAKRAADMLNGMMTRDELVALLKEISED